MQTWKEILAEGIRLLMIFIGIAFLFHGFPKIIFYRKEKIKKEDE